MFIHTKQGWMGTHSVSSRAPTLITLVFNLLMLHLDNFKHNIYM